MKDDQEQNQKNDIKIMPTLPTFGDDLPLPTPLPVPFPLSRSRSFSPLSRSLSSWAAVGPVPFTAFAQPFMCGWPFRTGTLGLCRGIVLPPPGVAAGVEAEVALVPDPVGFAFGKASDGLGAVARGESAAAPAPGLATDPAPAPDAECEFGLDPRV